MVMILLLLAVVMFGMMLGMKRLVMALFLLLSLSMVTRLVVVWGMAREAMIGEVMMRRGRVILRAVRALPQLFAAVWRLPRLA